jgi:hypothetical protein
MQDLALPIATVPTVEQINLEYRLSQSKASEAVQHAVNCGLLLLQVKAGLAHGEWLPWLKAQQESGAIEFSERTAQAYIRVASNPQRAADFKAPSIRAALELLTEEKPPVDQSALELETAKERLAREAAEANAKAEAEARVIADRDKESWRAQAIAEKKAKTEAEQKAQIAQGEAATLRRTLAAEADKLAEAKILETRLEVSKAKEEADKLKESIKSLKREREDAIQRGVQNKLREQQSSLDAKEAQLVSIEQRIDFLKSQLTPMEGANKAIAHHRPLISKIDHDINEIAVFIGDAFDPSKCPTPPEAIIREWEHGAQKIRQLADMIQLALRGALPHE